MLNNFQHAVYNEKAKVTFTGAETVTLGVTCLCSTFCTGVLG